MKKLNALALLCTYAFLSGNVMAKNVPVCMALKDTIPTIDKSVDELINESQILSQSGKHCQAARALQLSFVKDQRAALLAGADVAILESLEEGAYLNDFMSFSISLRSINKNHPRSEYLDYLLTQNYAKNLPTKVDSNPIGNLLKADGTPMGVVSEAKLVQRRFLNKYPNSRYAQKVQSDLLASFEISLAQANASFKSEYKAMRKSKNASVLQYHAADLAKAMIDNDSKKQRTASLSNLFVLYSKKRSVLPNSDLKISEINSRLSGEYYSKKLSRKVSKYVSKRKIKQTENTKLSDFTQGIIKDSELMANILSDGDLKSLLGRKKGNDKSIFLPITVSKSEKAVILRTLGVVGILMALDRPIMDFVQNNQSETMDSITGVTNSFGEMSGLGPIIGGSMALGLVFKNDQLKSAATKAFGAVVMGQLVVEVMKAMTHRSRPRDGKGPYDFGGAGWSSDNTSFPSGHSAGAWSVMTVFATEFKDNKVIPIVAYTLAAFTSFSRVYKNAHWLSDVTLGALVGWISGKIMYKIFKKKPATGPVSITPLVGGEITGGAVTIRNIGQQELKAWPIDYFKYIF